MVGLFALFLFGFDPQTFHLSNALCTFVGAFLLFFGLSIFSWTLLEGYQLYKSLKVTYPLVRGGKNIFLSVIPV